MLEFLRDQFWGQPYSWLFINDLPDEVLSRIGLYADNTTTPVLVSLVFFEKVESAGELELDLRCIVEWGDRLLVTFNATKTKLLSINRHRDPILVPVEMNGIELPEETIFCLLGLTFTLWTRSHIYSPLPRLLQGKWAPFIGHSISLLLNPSCICTNLPFGPCMEYCSHILDGAPRSHVLDL